jgi:hypothetical protein
MNLLKTQEKDRDNLLASSLSTLTLTARTPVATWFMGNPLTPMALVYWSLILPLKPVQILIGILGLF